MAKAKTRGNGRTVSDITIKKYADGFAGPEQTEDKDLIRAFELHERAAQLEKEAKQLKAQAYAILGPNYLCTGMSNLFLPDVGGIEVFQGSNAKTDLGKFCEVLVAEYRVPVEYVAAAKEAATTTKVNDKITVKFKAAKGGKGK